MKKLLSLLLAALLCASLSVGCGKADDTADTTTAPPETDTTVSEVTTPSAPETESPYDENGYLKDDLDPTLNYQGEKFTILYWEDANRVEFDVPLQTGDLIGDKIFTRNAAVEERLGIDFEWVGTPGNYNNQDAFIAKAAADVASGGEYEVFAGYSLSAATLAMQGLSFNLMDIENINFEQPWWPASLKELSTIKNRLYFCSGDISTNMLHEMNCTLFNKTLAEELKLGDLYQVVDQGKWTVDKMAEMASTAYSDLNGDMIANVGDQFGIGLRATFNFDTFFVSAGLHTVTKDSDDIPTVSEEFASEKTQALLEKLVSIFHDNNYAAFPTTVSGWSNTPFAEGRVLFIVDSNSQTSGSAFANTTVNYGVLPSPKFDEQQENYVTCVAFAFSMYTVSSALDDRKANMAGAVLECMASESYRQVTPAVFEVAMKLKYASDDNDSRMYDLVRESAQFDIGRIFSSPLQSISFAPFRNACSNATTNWASIIKAQSKVMDKLLDNIVTTLDNHASAQ